MLLGPALVQAGRGRARFGGYRPRGEIPTRDRSWCPAAGCCSGLIARFNLGACGMCQSLSSRSSEGLRVTGDVSARVNSIVRLLYLAGLAMNSVDDASRRLQPRRAAMAVVALGTQAISDLRALAVAVDGAPRAQASPRPRPVALDVTEVSAPASEATRRWGHNRMACVLGPPGGVRGPDVSGPAALCARTAWTAPPRRSGVPAAQQGQPCPPAASALLPHIQQFSWVCSLSGSSGRRRRCHGRFRASRTARISLRSPVAHGRRSHHPTRTPAMPGGRGDGVSAAGDVHGHGADLDRVRGQRQAGSGGSGLSPCQRPGAPGKRPAIGATVWSLLTLDGAPGRAAPECPVMTENHTVVRRWARRVPQAWDRLSRSCGHARTTPPDRDAPADTPTPRGDPHGRPTQPR